MPLNNPLLPLLAQSPFIVLDGALATELEARGCDLNDTLWSAKVLLENPESVYQVHLDYFRAGAQCAVTASYQATPAGFAARGMNEAQATALIKQSVELAQRARTDFLAERPDSGALLIAGSVGPYGAYLADGSEYRGDYTLSQAAYCDFHRPRMAALMEAGVDLLACETLPSFAETRALVALLAECPDTTAWFSFTLRDSYHLSDGTPLEDVVALLDGHDQVLAIGVNCIAPEQATAALQTLHGMTTLPLVVYPNSGETYDAQTKCWTAGGQACDSLEGYLDDWLCAGARLIGGCCRTTPADIALLAQRQR